MGPRVPTSCASGMGTGLAHRRRDGRRGSRPRTPAELAPRPPILRTGRTAAEGVGNLAVLVAVPEPANADHNALVDPGSGLLQRSEGEPVPRAGGALPERHRVVPGAAAVALAEAAPARAGPSALAENAA
jgi:hypothetical protein